MTTSTVIRLRAFAIQRWKVGYAELGPLVLAVINLGMATLAYPLSHSIKLFFPSLIHDDAYTSTVDNTVP